MLRRSSSPGGGRVLTREAADCSGRRVAIGTRVRVLQVDRALSKVVPPAEWRELQAMVGRTFSVYSIDENGAAWVETPLVPHPDGGTHSHSLALDSHEMEAVPESRRRPTKG
jgi:hypothetical protein